MDKKNKALKMWENRMMVGSSQRGDECNWIVDHI